MDISHLTFDKLGMSALELMGPVLQQWMVQQPPTALQELSETVAQAALMELQSKNAPSSEIPDPLLSENDRLQKIVDNHKLHLAIRKAQGALTKMDMADQGARSYGPGAGAGGVSGVEMPGSGAAGAMGGGMPGAPAAAPQGLGAPSGVAA